VDHPGGEAWCRIGSVPEHISDFCILRVKAIEYSSCVGCRHERQITEKLAKALHRSRETQLGSDCERRLESIAFERLAEREHVGLAGVLDTALAHRLDEVFADLDSDRLEVLLKVERVPTRTSTEVQQWAIEPRDPPLTTLTAARIQISEVVLLNGMLTRLSTVSLNERFV
jgi:hypothetical protein